MMDHVVWLAEMTRGGQTVVRVGRLAGEIIVTWPNLGTLVVARDGGHPRFEAIEGAPPKLVDKLRTGTAQALVGHLRGELTLHAASIADADGAVAFIGDSEAGKSTLAHAMLHDLSRWSFLSDDLLRVEGTSAVPTERVSWLDPNAKAALGLAPGERGPVEAPRPALVPVPLRAAVQLTFEEGPIRLRRLKGTEAADALMRSMVRIPLDEPAVRAADVDRLADLAQHVCIFELRRPRTLEGLRDTVRVFDEFWTGSAWS